MVEGRFDVDNGGEVTEITLARSVARAGRSRAWIDGRMSSIKVLADTAAELIELHGQHQHRILVHADAQRRALDQFGHIEHSDLEAARSRLRTLTDKSRTLGGDERERAREVDLLSFQVAEIDRASIDDLDEDGRLEVEEDRLAAASSHREAAAVALAALSESEDTGALDRLAEASGALTGRAPLSVLENRVRSAMAELSDVVTDLRSVVEDWDDDPERLAEIRARRQLFARARTQIWRQPGRSGRLPVERPAAPLDHRARRATGGSVGRGDPSRSHPGRGGRGPDRHRPPGGGPPVGHRDPGDVAEPGHALGGFSITVGGPGAGDQVTFLLGANPGEPPQPLAKVASGGELARTMLAIRLAITDAPGVMVFDEVDAGVGGRGGACGRGRAGRARAARSGAGGHPPGTGGRPGRPPIGGAQVRAVGEDPRRGGGARCRRAGGGAQSDAVGAAGQRVGSAARQGASATHTGSDLAAVTGDWVPRSARCTHRFR